MADKLVRLTAPNGSTVRVSKERAERLLSAGGYGEPKTSAKKSTSDKKS